MMITVIFVLCSCRLLLSDQVLRRNIGQDVTFSCFFENEAQFDHVSFMHQTTGDLLSLGSELFVDRSPINSRISLVRSSSNRLDLKIHSVSQEDSGLYTCMCNDEKLSSFLLEVFIPPRFVSFSPVGATFSYPEGSSMNLSCRAEAFPSANITWIYRNRNKQPKTIHYGEDVYVSLLEPTDSGAYECVASNGYHEKVSRTFYVTVQYPPRVAIKKLVDFHKRPIQFTCQVCSMPSSRIEWLSNGRGVASEQRFVTKTMPSSGEDGECLVTTITVQDSTHEQFGRYECRAENILGHNSDHIDFNLKFALQTKSQSENAVPSTVLNRTDRTSSSSKRLPRLVNRALISVLIVIDLRNWQ